jgi:hypothetical protein
MKLLKMRHCNKIDITMLYPHSARSETGAFKAHSRSIVEAAF